MSNGTMQWPSPGLGHAPSYQVSGIPYVTASSAVTSTVKKVSFPYVTQWIQVTHHTNDDLRLGFSANGVNDGLYILLPGAGTNAVSQTMVLPVKCSDIFLRTDTGAVTIPFYVVAGLTSIPVSELSGTGPSGNNWSGSVGVG
jgi:hypothetical protein